jgi:Ca2+-binding EF-hand superfamily protein
MKLASLLVVLVLSSVAHADRTPVNPFAPEPRAHIAQRGQLRALLLQHFDKNGDGKLGPRERRRAAKALHRIAAKLMRNDGKHQRQRRFVERFDRDGDGDVGPAEMPPGLADELRPLDRDGDGWLRGNELP